MQAGRELGRCKVTQWRAGAQGSGRPGQLEPSGDRAADNLRHQQGDPQVFSKSAQVSEENTRGWRRKHPKGLQETVLGTQAGIGRKSVFAARV